MCLDVSQPVYMALQQVYTAWRLVSVITYDLMSDKDITIENDNNVFRAKIGA